MKSFVLPLTTHELDLPRESDLWPPKATYHTLPIELLLEVFSYLPLKSLIATRGVSVKWRHLPPVLSPPARRSMLQHYLEVIKSPSFVHSRTLLLPELREFDREGYISTIEAETGVALPEEFRLWVLEWPLKAVSTWLWPGLDGVPPLPLWGIFPPRTMNLLNPRGMRPVKIQLRQRSTLDDTIVLRPMRHTPANAASHDWCWMLFIQVARDPFTMDFLLFGGAGLGAGLKDTVLVVKDDVVRPGMSWMEYLQKERERADESYWNKLEESTPIIRTPQGDLFETNQALVPPRRSCFRWKLRGPLQKLKSILKSGYRSCVKFCTTATHI